MAQTPEPFSLTTEERDDRVVVRPEGELDLAGAPELEAALLPPLREGRTAVVDLRALEFLDSSGVRSLVEARSVAQDHGGRLLVVRPHEGSAVWRVLEVSGVDQVLEIADDVDA